MGADRVQITDQRWVTGGNYPSLNYIRFGVIRGALFDAQMPEQFDSVTALTGAVFCDEWSEAHSFEVIKQRGAGRHVALCQCFSRGQTRWRVGWDGGVKEST